ncbi:hypothetical protein OIU85_014501 [Salix viminalis]|uniref:Pentatricopeptide repeat-containing protein n=1 Tax=Salix viminalis TaxID=40686 RepID=A0A9Q0NJ15_SALVM|nr:hypothetical protein OIU85_014501 [Salix viminalis]
MSLCSSASHLRKLKVSKSANHLLSRALTAHNHPEEHSNSRTFNGNQNAPSPLDSDLIAELTRHDSLSNPHFLNKIVSFCAKSGSFHLGIQIHSTILKFGFISNVYISSAVVDMYAKCGEISSARLLFDQMPQRTAVTWNSLISGYLAVNCPKIAIELFIKMLKAAINVTAYSVSSCLAGCSQLEAREVGSQVHGLILKTGLGYNVVVGTGLVDMYSKCGDVDDSRLVFDHMVNRNVITWTSMVTGYSLIEKPDEAMSLVREMARQDLRPNCVTYNSLLSSFSGPDCLSYCLQVHCCIIQLGLESNVYIAATLVTVYSKCSSSLEDFRKLGSVVMTCDHIAWNAVIAGYSNLGRHEEALRCFHEMKQADIDIDSYALTSMVGAIGNSSFLEEGKAMHALIHRTGYISHLNVQNGLVSMYARCGAIGDSKRVFWFMEEHDVISWNALLTAFAHHGYGREAVELFEQMRKTEIKPNSSTFLAVLCACSHVGFVDKGIEYFDLMKSDILLEPLKVEHYASLVDTFGRAGYLNEAETFINSMPIAPAPSVYKALLSASLVHGNREIAARSAKKLLELWPNDPATYVLLSSALTMEGNWDSAADLRKLMCDRGLRKKPDIWVRKTVLKSTVCKNESRLQISSLYSFDPASQKSADGRALDLLAGCEPSPTPPTSFSSFSKVILIPYVQDSHRLFNTRLGWLSPSVSAGLVNLLFQEMTCGSCSLPVQELRERDAWASPVLLNFPLCDKRCRAEDGQQGRKAMLKEFMAHPQSRTGAMAPIAVRHRHGNGPRTPTSPTVEDLLRAEEVSRWSPQSSPTFRKDHDLEHDQSPNHKKSVIAKVKERAKKWRSNLIKKKHSDDSNTTPSWGVSLDDDEDEEDPEYLGAPMYESEMAPEGYKEAARQHPRAVPVIPEKHVLPGSVICAAEDKPMQHRPKVAPEQVASDPGRAPTDAASGYHFITGEQKWDKGVSVKEYIMHKFEPGEDDRALSQVISQAISPRKAAGDVSMVDKVKDAVNSLLRGLGDLPTYSLPFS